MSGAKFEIERFNGSNDFGLWQMKICTMLVQQGLAKALDGEDKLPASLTTTQKKEIMDRAHSAVILSLGDKVLRKVSREKTVAEMAEEARKNRIQVSNSKKSLFFYVNLSKRYLQQYNDVELSGLGMANSTVVSIAEILKNNGFAVEKKIRTLTVDLRDDPMQRPFPKAKMEILLGKSENFDELMAAEKADEEGEDEA